MLQADLLAARAAQGLDDPDRAAVWLGRVDADDNALVAARLEQEAEMLVARRQFEAALQVLMLVLRMETLEEARESLAVAEGVLV